MKLKEKMMEVNKKVCSFVDDHASEICVGVACIVSYGAGCLIMGALKEHEYRWAKAIDSVLDPGVEYTVYAVDKSHTNADHNWVYMMPEKDQSRFQRSFEEK